MDSTTSEVTEFLISNGYPNLVTTFSENGVETMVAFKNLEEEDWAYIKCTPMVANKLMTLAKKQTQNAQTNIPSNSTTTTGPGNGQIVVSEVQLQIATLTHNSEMEMLKTKFEYEMKLREQEHQRQLDQKASESKFAELGHKIDHMSETNDLKRQIEAVRHNGQLEVLNAKLEAEKEKSKIEKENAKERTIFSPFGVSPFGVPSWWNSSLWGAWNSFPGFPFPVDSLLLNPPFYQVIQTWLGAPRLWTLMYRGTRDTFGGAQFHARCNNIGPTISIIRSTGNFIFGGYNPQNWTSSSAYLPGGGSFIFTLNNSYGDPPTVFRWNVSYGPYDNATYGPTFGGGHDMHVSNNSNSITGSYSNFPNSYTDTLGRGNATFTGAKNFQVSEIEVFRLN